MKQFWRLTALQLKLTFGIATLKAQLKGSAKEKRKAIASLLVLLLVGGGLLVGYMLLLNWLFDVVMLNVIHDTLLAISIMAGMLVVFIFGIPYAFSLYYAKDTAFLASLPIKQSTVFASKFTASLIGEVASYALFVVPAAIIYALHVPVTIQYVLSAVVIVLLGAMIPFALVNLVVALLMHVSVFTKHRDKFATAAGIVFLLLYIIGVQMLSRSMQNVSSEQIMAFLSGGLLDTVTSVFPPAKWASSALVYGGSTGLTNLLLFAAVCAVCFVLCYLVAGHLYQRGAAAQEETAVRNKKVDIKTAGKKEGSPLWAIFRKEWKSVLRSPTYVMNGLISVIMAPLMVVMMMIAIPIQEVASEIGMSGASASELLSSLPQDVMMMLMLIVVGFGYFFAAMNICGMTVYSREGESSWLMMVLPVTAATQLRGKILFSMSVTMLAALLMSIAFFFAWHAAWWICVVMFIGITLLSTPVVLVGIYIDLARPRLHWDSERRAMKSNTNTVYGMLLELVYLAAMIGLVFLINDLTMFIVAAMGISLVLSVVIYVVMIKAAPRLQARMMEL